MNDADDDVTLDDDELTPGQLAVLDSLATAVRAGDVSPADAADIELVIRRGHVHGARKRLTAARRRSPTSATRP